MFRIHTVNANDNVTVCRLSLVFFSLSHFRTRFQWYKVDCNCFQLVDSRAMQTRFNLDFLWIFKLTVELSAQRLLSHCHTLQFDVLYFVYRCEIHWHSIRDALKTLDLIKNWLTLEIAIVTTLFLFLLLLLLSKHLMESLWFRIDCTTNWLNNPCYFTHNNITS